MRVLVATADFEAVGFNIPVAEFMTAAICSGTRAARLGPDLLGDSSTPAAAFARARAAARPRDRRRAAQPAGHGRRRQRLQVGSAVRVPGQSVHGWSRDVTDDDADAPHRHRAPVPRGERQHRTGADDHLYRLPAHHAPRRSLRTALASTAAPACRAGDLRHANRGQGAGAATCGLPTGARSARRAR